MMRLAASLSEHHAEPNKPLDVRAKQLRRYSRCPLNFTLRVGGFAPRQLRRWVACHLGAMIAERMIKEHLNPPDLPNWRESFSQVVVVRTGATRTIYVSGQVSVDGDNNIIGLGDLGRQAEVALQNLSKALAAGGATPADVVRLGIYVKDYQRDQAAVISSALRKTFVAGRMPTSTWLGVSSLALDEILIEIEATAVIDAE